MPSLVLEPLQGTFGVRFGAGRDAIRGLLGVPGDSYRKGTDVDTWLDGQLHVFYSDRSLLVEYIEVFSAPNLHVSCAGVELFNQPAAKVVESLKAAAQTEPDVADGGASVTFPQLELSLWRPFVSKRGEGSQFQSVGIGRAGYYSAMVV